MDIEKNTLRVGDYYNLPPLNMLRRERELKLIHEKYTPKWNLEVLGQDHIFGLEFEIENVPNVVTRHLGVSHWTITTDGSLRNHGLEFISVPLRGHQVLSAIKELHTKLEKDNPCFSNRTSTHVHLNVRDMSIDQIAGLVLTYIVVESALFNWVGHGRDTNNFCVPLYNLEYHNLIGNLLTDPKTSIRNWAKYSAFNLAPIARQGTVEFRHMHGTCDPERIVTWLNLISRLKMYARSHSLNEIANTILDLNTNSLYDVFLTQVFKNQVTCLNVEQYRANNYQTLEDRILYCKGVTHLLVQRKEAPLIQEQERWEEEDIRWDDNEDVDVLDGEEEHPTEVIQPVRRVLRNRAGTLVFPEQTQEAPRHTIGPRFTPEEAARIRDMWINFGTTTDRL